MRCIADVLTCPWGNPREAEQPQEAIWPGLERPAAKQNHTNTRGAHPNIIAGAASLPYTVVSTPAT